MLKKYRMGLESGIRKKPIPDPNPEVKKHRIPYPNLHSATLFFIRLVVVCVCLSISVVDPQHFNADPHCKVDSNYVFPENQTARPFSQFPYSCIC